MWLQWHFACTNPTRHPSHNVHHAAVYTWRCIHNCVHGWMDGRMECRPRWYFGPHGLRLWVPKQGHDHQELIVLPSEHSWFHYLSTMCAMKSQCKALEHIRTAFGPLCGWKCLFFKKIKMSEEGTQKVADVPTGVVQDAMLDHMGSDFRCQNEVMTTKSC